MHQRTSPLLVLSLLAVSAFSFACAKPPPPASAPSDAAASEASTSQSAECTGEQFVACKSSEDCTRKGGNHIHAHACHDRAAAACDALACKHGCNIHGTHVGGPKEVFCAIDEAANYKNTCGGYSGWQCPENMTCEATRSGFDQPGKCVPKPM